MLSVDEKTSTVENRIDMKVSRLSTKLDRENGTAVRSVRVSRQPSVIQGVR